MVVDYKEGYKMMVESIDSKVELATTCITSLKEVYRKFWYPYVICNALPFSVDNALKYQVIIKWQ